MLTDTYDEFGNCLHADQATAIDEKTRTYACICLTCGQHVGSGSAQESGRYVAKAHQGEHDPGHGWGVYDTELREFITTGWRRECAEVLAADASATVRGDRNVSSQTHWRCLGCDQSVPHAVHTCPGCGWIIGRHSDGLRSQQ